MPDMVLADIGVRITTDGDNIPDKVEDFDREGWSAAIENLEASIATLIDGYQDKFPKPVKIKIANL